MLSKAGKIFTAAVLLGIASLRIQAAKIVLEPAQESRLWLEGDSTLHRFSSTAAVVNAQLSLEADAAAPEAVLAAVAAHRPAALVVTIPVVGLKSAHAGLDKNLRKALKADKFPDIRFVLDGYKSEAGKITASGILSLAGATKTEALGVTLAAKNGRLIIDGEQPMLMTDFGIKPPTVMLGAIKTDNRIMVKFHLMMQPRVDDKKTTEK